jgi:FtsP/CotA-like multicopper oxidase with cupredoxin domain
VLNRRFILSGGIAALCDVFTLPTVSAQSADYSQPRILRAGKIELDFGPDAGPKRIGYAFDGLMPGPVLRYAKGTELNIRVQNDTDLPFAVHWQGLHVPNDMDGACGLTQEPIAPLNGYTYRFPLRDSGLFAYRPDHPQYAHQLHAGGLFGLLIVDEPHPPPVDRDIALVFSDWPRLATDDAQSAATNDHFITLNGELAPYQVITEPCGRLRLRLWNASADHIMMVIVEGAAPIVIAIDGQPTTPFEPARHLLPFAPGTRFDVILDLPTHEHETILFKLRQTGDDTQAVTLLRITTQGMARAAPPPLNALEDNFLLPTDLPLARAFRRDVIIEEIKKSDGQSAWTMNGVEGQGTGDDKPLLTVARGSTVVLGLINKTDSVQSLHLHGFYSRLLHALDDGWDPYWRDTFLLAPHKTSHIAFVADTIGKWRFASGSLTQAARGLTSWIEVV